MVPAPLQFPKGVQSSCSNGVLGPGHRCGSAACCFERSLGHLGQQSVCQAPSQSPGLLPGAAGPNSEAALPIPAPQGPAVLPSCRQLLLAVIPWQVPLACQAPGCLSMTLSARRRGPRSPLLPPPPPVQKAAAAAAAVRTR